GHRGARRGRRRRRAAHAGARHPPRPRRRGGAPDRHGVDRRPRRPARRTLRTRRHQRRTAEHVLPLRLGDAQMPADLPVPAGPRDRAVAGGLNAAGMGTLLLDLLTDREDQFDRLTAALRFDLELLTLRLIGAIDRLTEGLESAPHTAGLPIGLLGAGTGAAAALAASAARPRVGAVVSRGGRPDLAGPSLPRVRVPVLLIAGDRGAELRRLN